MSVRAKLTTSRKDKRKNKDGDNKTDRDLVFKLSERHRRSEDGSWRTVRMGLSREDLRRKL